MRIAIMLALVSAATAVYAAPVRRHTTAHNANWNDVPYGVNAFHPNGPAPQGHMAHFTDANMQRLKDGGVRWVRLMVDWRYCEPAKGQYYWDALEATVAKLNREKIGISACLYEAPAWAKLPGSDFRVKPEDYEAFGEAIGRRFRDRIAAYEIENENPTGSWPKVAERMAAVYVPLLKAAYRGIKRGDPKAVVVMTGLWEFPMYYLEDMYRLGAKGSFDAVNMHYYLRMDRDPTYPDPFRGDLDRVLKQVEYVTRKYGDAGMPIWFTEYGWPATDESQAFPVGEEKMADYMGYFLQHCKDSGLVEKAFWYVYYLSDGMALWHEREDRKRPAWYVYKEWGEQDPTWVGDAVKPIPAPTPASRAAGVPNGDFEEAAGWAASGGGAVSFATRDPEHGRQYLHLVCAAPGAGADGKSFPLEPDRAYELTGYIRMRGGLEDKAYAHAMIHLELLGPGDTPLGLIGPRKGEKKDDRSTNYYVSDTGGKWYQVHYFVFTPPETRGGRILLRMGHPDAPKGEADFDDIRVQPVDLAAYER